MTKDSIVNIYQKMRDFMRNMKKENLSIFAAGSAFFIFLSLVPILIMICTIIPFTPLSEEILLKIILEIMPDQVDGIMTEIVNDVYRRSAGVLSIAALATLWSAGRGVLAVMRGLNSLNEVEEKRNYFVVRIVSSFYTLIMLLIIIVSMVLLVFGNTLVRVIVIRIPGVIGVFDLLMNLRFLFIWIILTIIFSAFYTYLPDKKLKFREQLPGASFAAVIWSIFSWCFSIYVDYGNSFNIYGGLAIIVIFMMWMYMGMYIMFVGAYINKHFSTNEGA